MNPSLLRQAEALKTVNDELKSSKDTLERTLKELEATKAEKQVVENKLQLLEQELGAARGAQSMIPVELNSWESEIDREWIWSMKLGTFFKIVSYSFESEAGFSRRLPAAFGSFDLKICAWEVLNCHFSDSVIPQSRRSE